MGTALPVPGWFASVAPDGGACGFVRRHKAAASAKAHGRLAWPILFPEGPSRVPADACAHVPRRPDETQACPRGQQELSGVA